MRVGLISDTHGRLRPEVFAALEDVDHVLHAGDIGPHDLLLELGAIAPVTAVWGNTDGFDLRSALPEIAELELAGRRVVVVHGHQLGSPTPGALRASHPDAAVIVFGHTHRPLVERNGSLVVNPGSAGAARFGIPPSIGILTLADAHESVELIELPQ